MSYHISLKRTKKEFNKLYKRLKKFKINNIHTDKCKVYDCISSIYNPTKTKNETTQVESFNADLRHYLPFLRRKTKNYIKSIKLLDSKLKLFLYFFNKKIKNYLFFIKECSIFVKEKIDVPNNGFGWSIS